MTDELWKLDAVAQAELVAKKILSATELVDAALDRIARLEPAIHALESMDAEQAKECAKRTPKGPLFGVPFLIKDLLPHPGLPCRMGSRLFRGHMPSAASDYSRKLSDAGLITLGKSTTSELGLLGSTESLLSGITKNPWNPALSATGSSGGSAAAVASGMVPIAHANDGGGSIRIPASACGLFGLKPSRGRSAKTDVMMAYDLLSEGCLSRSVRDAALFLSLTEIENTQLGPKLGFVRATVAGPLRIGFYDQTLMGHSPIPEVKQALDRAVSLCQSLGHTLIPIEPPPVNAAALSHGFFAVAGFGMTQLAAMMTPLLGRPPGPDELEPFTLELAAWFSTLPAKTLPQAFADFDEAGITMRAYLDRFDVVLCPTLPILPPPLGTLAPTLDRQTLIQRTELLAGYTPIHSISGVPAMSVPIEQSPDGLPIGMHFAAPMGQEARLLQLAYQLEQAAPWAQRWPTLATA